jgi:hypothetical protein
MCRKDASSGLIRSITDPFIEASLEGSRRPLRHATARSRPIATPARPRHRRLIAGAAERSVRVEGDTFFGFLATGAIEPWLPASNDQNTVVTRAAASAAGQFAIGGFTTVYDGVVGPWFLATFAAATGLDRLDYVILLPTVEVCVRRLRTRTDHNFNDEAATRKMHAEFSSAQITESHVLRDPPQDVNEVASLVLAAANSGDLVHVVH